MLKDIRIINIGRKFKPCDESFRHNLSGLLSTWSSDLNINLKNGERYDDFDVCGDDAVDNDAQDDFDDAFDNG